jgi:hypothetical protein
MRIFHFGALLPAAPHFFAFIPISTSRRMASGRDRPGSFCFAIQASIAAKGRSSIRTPTTVPVPVVTGRPRLFALTLIDFAMKYRYRKIRLRGSRGQHSSMGYPMTDRRSFLNQGQRSRRSLHRAGAHSTGQRRPDLCGDRHASEGHRALLDRERQGRRCGH